MIVDSIDTMMLMGLDDEVTRARNWVQDKLSFDVNGEHNTFEVSQPPVSCAHTPPNFP